MLTSMCRFLLPSLSGRAMTSGTRVLTRVLGAGWRLTGPLML